MTKQELETTSFKKGMRVLYKGEEREVLTVSFRYEQILLGQPDEKFFEILVNYSECELIKEKE
jgi:hypothetical protein